MIGRTIISAAALALWSGHALAQSVVYPLEVGTKWQWSLYWSATPYRVEIKRDTLAPNGNRYAMIPAYWSIPERWERHSWEMVFSEG